MIKMMILASRKASMSHAEFRQYVTEIHGPLVKSVLEVAAGIRHYHYNFPVPGAVDAAFAHNMATTLDIVTQGWFDSREAQLANMAQPRYLQIIRPDEGKFANEAGAVMHYTREECIKEGAPTLHKMFYFRRRHPSLTRDAFQQEWLTRFPQALEGYLAESPSISRYVQNHVLPESEHPDGDDTKFFDVIDEFFISAHTGMECMAHKVNLLAQVREVEAELLDASRTRAYAGETIYNIP